jgi:hypothetical protein
MNVPQKLKYSAKQENREMVWYDTNMNFFTNLWQFVVRFVLTELMDTLNSSNCQLLVPWLEFLYYYY